MALEHEAITEKIIGAAFEIYKVLVYGFLEKVYQKAMQVELTHPGLKTELKTPIKVRFKGYIIGDYFADILIEEKVVIEIKIPAASYGVFRFRIALIGNSHAISHNYPLLDF